MLVGGVIHHIGHALTYIYINNTTTSAHDDPNFTTQCLTMKVEFLISASVSKRYFQDLGNVMRQMMTYDHGPGDACRCQVLVSHWCPRVTVL